MVGLRKRWAKAARLDDNALDACRGVEVFPLSDRSDSTVGGRGTTNSQVIGMLGHAACAFAIAVLSTCLERTLALRLLR